MIDDDRGMVKLLTKWLRVAGKIVMTAASGGEGVARAGEEQPECILLDLMLPDVDGVEIVRRLRADERTRGIPVIFISSCVGVENDKGDETIEVDGAVYRIFAKPLHNRKLLSEIRREVNRSLHG